MLSIGGEGGATVRTSNLLMSSCGSRFQLFLLTRSLWALFTRTYAIVTEQYNSVHTYAIVTEQYNSVLHRQP